MFSKHLHEEHNFAAAGAARRGKNLTERTAKMVNVWKIGSRWGNGGPSVLDLFLEYECVFFGGKHDSGIGDCEYVQVGDLFIVSDGSIPVAIGEALGKFKSYKATGIRFRKRDADEFIDDDVVLCPARLILLDEKERNKYWSIDTRRRFCHAPGAADKVRSFWEKKGSPQKEEPFDIKTLVVSLLDESYPNRLLHQSIKYSIPIYQRPYSWGEEELRCLMEDLHQGLLNNDPVFMGTIQLSQPIPLKPDGSIRSYNVIDGQQRLTTFLILLSILEKISSLEPSTLDLIKTNFRTSVNKRAAQDDLDAFLTFFEKRSLTDKAPKGQEHNPYIANAKILFGLVQEFASLVPEEESESDGMVATDKVLAEYAARLWQFISHGIKIVVIETHAGLSKTLKIFNTINSSGLDLGSEDIFKVRFYEYLRKLGESEDVFDKISEVYESIEEYNRHPCVDVWLSMSQILATYQRALVARCDLNATTFSMSQETFFDHLFDTVLGVHIWEDFKVFVNPKANNGTCLLSIGDLRNVVECHLDYLKACAKDPDLRIVRRMYWETRYGYAWDFPVLAMIKGVVDCNNVKQFAKGLLMSLVPPSLYFAKHVYHGRACLLLLLKGLWNGSFKESDSAFVWCQEKWQFNGLSLEQMMEAALDYSIAWTPKWKNLLCKLVEYFKSSDKDKALYERLFDTYFDIEHIQSFTDDKDYKRVWKDWGEELNKIGNLAMFERDLNRSVHNHPDQKIEAYGKSSYKSLKELKQKVVNWTKEEALKRRETIAKMLCAVIAGKGRIE